jgi:ParB/RepB/Spo0J family partition protein
MPTKTTDRLAEIRARVARRTAEAPDQADEITPAPAQNPDDALAAASAHFFGTVEQIIQSRPVQRIPIGHIAPDNRPEMRQARLIPLPEELLAPRQNAPIYQAMIDELRALGQSLLERQIQPIIVYPGTSSIYPAARYLIMVGHRRWTAASLAGLDALDAVVVEAPTPTERVRIQYAENEAREDFSDMERAWALTQMKEALGDATPWEAVEEQFRISRTRRHELTRLLAFTRSQQQQIALLRLQETQIRSLHSAVRAGELAPMQVDTVLGRLSEIAVDRAAAPAQSQAGGTAIEAAFPRRNGIDAPTVARLVARARRLAPEGSKEPSPRWLQPLRDQLAHASKGLGRARDRVAMLSDEEARALMVDLAQLTERLEAVNKALLQRKAKIF